MLKYEKENWGQKSTLTSKVTCKSYKKYYKDLGIQNYKELKRSIKNIQSNRRTKEIC